MTNINPFAVKQDTQSFLLSLSTKLMNEVLDNVANHYGITRKEAYEKVVNPEAENIMDYITGKKRAAIHLFYKKFKNAA